VYGRSRIRFPSKTQMFSLSQAGDHFPCFHFYKFYHEDNAMMLQNNCPSVLRIMRRSIRNFNWAYPWHLTVHHARGGGDLNVALEGWGIWTRFIFCFDIICLWVFFQGLTDLPLLVNNSVKRVLKRSLKVSLQHISLWKACKVFDWRRNLSLRRGSSVLLGGAFEQLFFPKGREIEQANLQKFKCPGVAPGRGGVGLDVELSNWSAHYLCSRNWCMNLG